MQSARSSRSGVPPNLPATTVRGRFPRANGFGNPSRRSVVSHLLCRPSEDTARHKNGHTLEVRRFVTSAQSRQQRPPEQGTLKRAPVDDDTGGGGTDVVQCIFTRARAGDARATRASIRSTPTDQLVRGAISGMGATVNSESVCGPSSLGDRFFDEKKQSQKKENRS